MTPNVKENNIKPSSEEEFLIDPPRVRKRFECRAIFTTRKTRKTLKTTNCSDFPPEADFKARFK